MKRLAFLSISGNKKEIKKSFTYKYYKQAGYKIDIINVDDIPKRREYQSVIIDDLVELIEDERKAFITEYSKE